MIVGFQGAPAAFSDEAARKLGATVTRGYATFEALLAALRANEIPYALLPWENTAIGAIGKARHALERTSKIVVVGEIVHRIEHCLVGTPGASFTSITEVRSHPAALAQCRRFFERHRRLRPVEVYDTAGAVATLVAESPRTSAAIASASAAAHYGAEVLIHAIEDDASNATRFLLLRLR